MLQSLTRRKFTDNMNNIERTPDISSKFSNPSIFLLDFPFVWFILSFRSSSCRSKRSLTSSWVSYLKNKSWKMLHQVTKNVFVVVIWWRWFVWFYLYHSSGRNCNLSLLHSYFHSITYFFCKFWCFINKFRGLFPN